MTDASHRPIQTLQDLCDVAAGKGKLNAGELLREVRANLKRLDECKGPHEFEVTETTLEGKLPTKYQCKRCGGTTDQHAVRWYEDGRKHERRSMGIGHG